MAKFSAQTPTGEAVQQLETLVRTAIFKPAANLVGSLLQQAAERIDRSYEPKPGEHFKGRQVLDVQCLFGSFAIDRDSYYDSRRKRRVTSLPMPPWVWRQPIPRPWRG